MLFGFKLRQLEEVQPWGSDEPTLHWFGLTDGWYWWQVGGQQLFRYSQPRIERWVVEYPKFGEELPYVDYQVVRPWEDLLDCLPDVLDPVPDDLAQRIGNIEELEALNDKAFLWAAEKNDEAAWDLQELAFRWLWNRGWDSGYLRCPPKIWLWTQGETFHLKWDNRNVIDEGVPVWDAAFGEITMPVIEYVAEVTSFHERLMAAMAERVDAVRSGAFWPETAVNLDGLIKEQENRATWLQNTLTMRQQHQDWDEVRAAISTIERMCYNNGVEGL